MTLPRSKPLPKFRKTLRRKSKTTSVDVRVVDGVRIYPCGREVCLDTKRGREIYTARTMYLYVRQDGLCAICGKWMHPYDATLDHERARGNGGAFRDDRTQYPDGRDMNAALCVTCQGIKGSKRYEWRGGKYVPKERAA